MRMLGAVILGAMAGFCLAIITLFLGAGFWSAFMTYVVTGTATMLGVMTVAMFRGERDLVFSDNLAGEETDDLAQWLDDPETRAEKPEAQDETTDTKRVA